MFKPGEERLERGKYIGVPSLLEESGLCGRKTDGMGTSKGERVVKKSPP